MYRPLQANVKTPSGTVSFTNLRYQVGNVPDANAKGQRSGTTAVITIDAELPTEIQDKAVKKVLLLMANGTPNCTAIAERTPHHRLYQALPESDPLGRPPSRAAKFAGGTTPKNNNRVAHQATTQATPAKPQSNPIIRQPVLARINRQNTNPGPLNLRHPEDRERKVEDKNKEKRLQPRQRRE